MERKRSEAVRQFWELELGEVLELWVDEVMQGKMQNSLIKIPEFQKSNADTP